MVPKNVMWSVGWRVTQNYNPQLLFWDVTSQSRFVARCIQQGEVFSSHTDILRSLQFLLCLQLWSKCPWHFVDVCSKWIRSFVCQHFNEKNVIVNIEIATTKLPSSFDVIFFLYLKRWIGDVSVTILIRILMRKQRQHKHSNSLKFSEGLRFVGKH